VKDFTQSHQVNAERVPQISPQLLPSTALAVHYSLISLSLGTIQPELLNCHKRLQMNKKWKLFHFFRFILQYYCRGCKTNAQVPL